MKAMTMRPILPILWFLFWATAALSKPTPYTLNAAKSDSAFTYVFENNPVRGSVPITQANVSIDFDNLANSKVSTTLSAKGAKAGFVFATQTLRGPQMLNADAHPTIRFTSTKISGRLPNATIRGNLTMRGITRPVTLKANLFRTEDTDDKLRQLVIRLQGTINRNDFAMSGFQKLVGPTISLDIRAHITRK